MHCAMAERWTGRWTGRLAETVEVSPVPAIREEQHQASGQTHETYCHAVRAMAVGRLTETEAAPVLRAKLVYGVGSARGARGVCYYQSWSNGHGPEQPEAIIEVAAAAEESLIQITGTTIHECAHVLAGHGAGHGPAWKAAAKQLGLVQVEAAGQHYTAEHFAPELWAAIEALPSPQDGTPVLGARHGIVVGGKPRPCTGGIGTRGGKSRGVGSGSRLRLFECGCEVPVKVRVARDEFNATCNDCGKPFERKG